MNLLEDFLKPTQAQLFQQVQARYDGRHICRKGKFLLVQGDAPILLVAHLDTVHKEPVRDICMSQNGPLRGIRLGKSL